MKYKVVEVYNKQEQYLNYSLTYITLTNDTISLTNQWKSSIISSDAKAFYITDSSGLTSPIFETQGSLANVFKVLFETTRIFENESWRIKEGQIIPKNECGRDAAYRLIKQNR